jgi:hypothetical protein
VERNEEDAAGGVDTALEPAQLVATLRRGVNIEVELVVGDMQSTE